MPFVMVYRVPLEIEDEVLYQLNDQMVEIVSSIMKCPKDWVGPEFYKRTLRPRLFGSKMKGANTVLIKLETGMFHGRADDDPEVQEVLKALTDAVWEAFGKKYEVETAINGWHPGWKDLKEAEE